MIVENLSLNPLRFKVVIYPSLLIIKGVIGYLDFILAIKEPPSQAGKEVY